MRISVQHPDPASDEMVKKAKKALPDSVDQYFLKSSQN